MKEGQKCWDQYNDHFWIKLKNWKKIKAQDFTIECSSSKTKKYQECLGSMEWTISKKVHHNKHCIA